MPDAAVYVNDDFRAWVDGASIQIKQVIADHSSGKAIKPTGSQTASAQ